MKKSIKNTIMIGMAAVLIGTSAITFSYARDNQKVSAMQQSGFSQQMPDFGGRNNGSFDKQFPQDRHNSEKDFNNFGSQNNQQQLPGGNGSSQQNGQNNEMPSPPQQNGSGDSSNNNQQQPPHQGTPNGEAPSQNNSDSSSDGTQNNQDNTDSSAPNDTKTSIKNTNNELEQFTSDATNKAKMIPSKHNTTVISIACYAFLAIQLAIILLIIIYLILSKFNTLSFNTVFPENKKNG